ncbi:MAG: alpha/beta hydrolase [Leptospiraceae bacterium]|nr:alpha/beta hydrolase [Leptospiraceae bacterium]
MAILMKTIGKLIVIGDAGHINTASGYGKWDLGLSILRNFDEISV